MKMRKYSKTLGAVGVIAAALSLTASIGSAQNKGGNNVVRVDPGLDDVLDKNVRYEELKSDYFGISEGPVWISEKPKGYLLFADIGANVIYKWTQENVMSVYADKTGYTGDYNEAGFIGFANNNGRMNILNFGSNGTVVDPQGRLIVCAQGDRSIVRIEKDGKHTVLADRYQGKRLNRPNDLVLKSDGAIYFTDPLQAGNRTMEQDRGGVYLLKNGVVTLLNTDVQPNGLTFSPDEKILYLTDSRRKAVMRYDVQADDTIANGRVFIDVSADKAAGNLDGMKVDVRGNLYTTGPGGVWIISPAGKHLGTILLPETGTNMAFGGDDGKTMYIMDRKSIGKIRVKIPGALWKPAP
ncbi:MAG: SMP-30/gluconolactonase/LRE family protein [Bryobacteraceae bacterium]